MRGLLADVNVQGHVEYLRRLMNALGLLTVLDEFKIEFVTFRDLDLPRDLDDRALWSRCQQDGWVLFTENRNEEDENSLQATLANSWQMGHLPVLTLANKARFENSAGYAARVAADVAELLFGVAQGQYRDQPRIYVEEK